MRHTKIIATLGPATSTSESIESLIVAGVNVVRLNFSHGTHADHRKAIRMTRTAADKSGLPVAVLVDLQGPKIRTGSLAGGKSVTLTTGQEFLIYADDVVGDKKGVCTSYPLLPKEAGKGDRILLSDGLIELRVKGKKGGSLVTEVLNGGVLKERQGVNLPGVDISAPALTDKDLDDLQFALENDVDFVAISFVREAGNVRRVKTVISASGKDTPVIAKIEKPEAIEFLDKILDAADGIMVARGDLGVEVSPERLPLIQKHLIRVANLRGKPVITATQMLESMITNPRPTRAEASDVANAILDGTDVVMLSGETAVGRYPLEAVKTMARIAEEVDGESRLSADRRVPWPGPEVSSVPEAIGAAAAAIVKALPDISAVWVYTQSGTTARLISEHRPGVPIVGFTPSERMFRRMALYSGVMPILTGPASNAAEFNEIVFPLMRDRGLVKDGDTVIITGSHPFNEVAPTNFVKIQKV
jgi:pyruvate kinase